MVRQELATAVRVCPRLAPLVRDAVLKNPASASPEDAARIAALAAELLPQPERNNDQTVAWGWRKHGIRVVTMLAIALEDPEVRSPNAYFGKLATQDKGARRPAAEPGADPQGEGRNPAARGGAGAGRRAAAADLQPGR